MYSNIVNQSLEVLSVAFVVGLASGAWICVLQLTDFLAEYISIFNRIFRIKKKFDTSEEFLDWLAQVSIDKESMSLEFLYKLLMCPFCIGTWFCFFFCLLIGYGLVWNQFIVAWFASLAIASFVKTILYNLASKNE